jgi:thiamine biosynthesis lipoprotein
MRLGLGIVLLLLAVPARGDLVERTQWSMGTELRIVLEAGARTEDEVDSIFRACFEVAGATEAVLSRWDPRAELARLNAAAGSDFRASDELFGWLERCLADSRRTNGAVDPTVGTWILHPGRAVSIGMNRMHLDASRKTVRMPEGMALDSGGDGKGVAVDRIVELLVEERVDALVSFGGSSSYGLGSSPSGDGWALAVMDVAGEVLGTVTLRDQALSVSHSTLLDHLGNGQTARRPHIYDPSTGELVTEPRTSVVIAPTATVAEVLSTALIVRGADGLEFVEAYPGARALISPGSDPMPDWISPAHRPE